MTTKRSDKCSDAAAGGRSRYDIARRVLIFWTLFIGIGAVAGACGMLIDPSGKSVGMDAMLPYFRVLPFADILFCDLTFSGIALLIVNGITNLTAAALMLAKKRVGAVLGGIFGVTLMLWICIQFYMFPPNFMSSAYFVFGLAQAITGYAACVFARQEDFSVNISDYPNVGTNHRRLVVYFSRMGYTEKLAYEEADRTGADIVRLISTERTEGTAGFWWCGRFAMHRWDMPTEPTGVRLEDYEHVTVCTPIWVFALAAPVRGFCRASAGRIREVDYVIVHHTNGRYMNAAREMDELLGVTHTAVRSVRCRVGSFRELGNIKN